MSYQLQITRYRSANDNRLWFLSGALFVVLILNTLGVAFGVMSLLFIPINALLCIGLIATILKLNKHTQKITFVKIQDDKLEYFCPEQQEIITVPAEEITQVTTRFCELQLHTNQGIHSLNMGMIRNEKTRWEIKEMIRQFARERKLSVAS